MKERTKKGRSSSKTLLLLSNEGEDREEREEAEMFFKQDITPKGEDEEGMFFKQDINLAIK